MKEEGLGNMMKRIVSLLLVVIMLLMNAAWADEGSYIGNMKVINCEDWVSLRQYTDTDSPRLVKVPLGATVKNCRWENSEFIYGEYGGQSGYILAKYLSNAAENAGGYAGTMKVVNCDEWVSLRKAPDKDSSRIAKVPLGASVKNCYWETSEFVYAEYNGQGGYILGEYLAKSSTNGSYVGNMQVYNCDEWVSLRKEADTGSKRLAKVPLGATVENCSRTGTGFVYAEYNGIAGYILDDYLSTSFKTRGGFVGNMKVVNCQDWVSLRKTASTGADRLAEVPLGAVVTNCKWESSKFLYCEYNGQGGYILANYLLKTDEAPVKAPASGNASPNASPNNLSIYPDKMVVYDCKQWVTLWEENSTSSKRLNIVPLGAVVDIIRNGYKTGFYEVEYNGMRGYILAGYLTEYIAGKTYDKAGYQDILGNGREMVNIWVDGCHIIISHGYGTGETLSIVCLDANDEIVWNYYAETSELFQLDCLSAFCNDETGVLVYNDADGVSLLDIHTGKAKWMIPSSTLSVAGMCGYTENGMSYVGGYFGPDPVAIDENGNIIWESYAGQDYFWLYKLERASGGLLAYYEAVETGDSGGRICYDMETGEEIWRMED